MAADIPTRVAALEQIARSSNKRFDRIDGRFDRMVARLDRIETKLERIEIKLEGIEAGQADDLRFLTRLIITTFITIIGLMLACFGALGSLIAHALGWF